MANFVCIKFEIILNLLILDVNFISRTALTFHSIFNSYVHGTFISMKQSSSDIFSRYINISLKIHGIKETAIALIISRRLVRISSDSSYVSTTYDSYWSYQAATNYASGL